MISNRNAQKRLNDKYTLKILYNRNALKMICNRNALKMRLEYTENIL